MCLAAATGAIHFAKGPAYIAEMEEVTMHEKPKEFYRVFAPGVPNDRDISERLTAAAAQSRKREILMAYPAATVRIERTDESGRAK